MVSPKIIRSRRRSIALEVNRNGEVIVKAPKLLPKFFIEKFISEKKDWIEETLAKVKKHLPIKKKYTEGESFLFLGKEYALAFYTGTKIGLKENMLFFPKTLQFRIQKELVNWYKDQAEKFITKRLAFHAKKMQATYTDVFFSDTSSKWGTCFADNTLQFNWRLIMAPVMVLDYVIIHELTHTTEKNHQDSFWSRVRFFTPAYKQHRKWLSENAHLLQI